MQKTRRRFLIGSGTVLGTIGAGLAVGPPKVRAEVTMGELSIPDKSMEDEDGEIYAPWLKVTGDWKYNIEQTPNKWEVRLVLVDSDGTRAQLDMDSGSLSSQSNSGSYSTVGKITDASFYSKEDFTVPNEGESKDIQIHVLMLFFVREDGGTVYAKDRLRHHPTITVTHAKEAAVAGGEGTIKAQHDEGDNEPF